MEFLNVLTFYYFQNEEISSNSSIESQIHNYEVSFEYLMSKNCLKWITIGSEQAMLMSVSLQSMVDELLNQKSGNDLTSGGSNGGTVAGSLPQMLYIKRDGSNNRLSESCSTDNFDNLRTAEPYTMRQRLKDKFSTNVFFRVGKDSVHNEAFEVIGDDDL